MRKNIPHTIVMSGGKLSREHGVQITIRHNQSLNCFYSHGNEECEILLRPQYVGMFYILNRVFPAILIKIKQ